MNYIKQRKSIVIYLKNNLSKRRFNHSLKVAKMAKYIAKIKGKDMRIAYIAGLLHDIAREFRKEILAKEILKHNDLSEDFLRLPQIYHGPVGSTLIKSLFNIDDKIIINSVKYHSTGHPDLGDIEKIIYISDYISEDRIHISDSFRKRILSLDIDNMVREVVNNTKEYLSNRGETLLPETVNMYKKIIEDVE